MDAADTQNNGKGENKLHSNANTAKRAVENVQNGQSNYENNVGNSINNQELKSELKAGTVEMKFERNQVKSRRESIISEDNIPDETVDLGCVGTEECDEVVSEAGSEVEDMIYDRHHRDRDGDDDGDEDGDYGRKRSVDSDVDAALQASLSRYERERESVCA